MVSAPLALSAFELELDVVDGVRWSIFAALLFLGNQLLSESVVVLFCASLIYHDFLLVIGDLVDDIFRTATAELELIESRHAFRVYGESGC